MSTKAGQSQVQYELMIGLLIIPSVFYKLALRTLPNNFKPNSIYVHYPMTIPSENKKILTDLGREDQYSWEKPAPIPPRINLTSYIGVKHILERSQEFNVTWGEATAFFMGKGGWDFMLSGDTPFHANQKEVMGKSLYQENWQQSIKDFYEDITLKLLHKHSCKIAGLNQVDITRE